MTKARFAVAVLAVAGLISGCVTGQKMGDIHAGMSKGEVVSILGNPDGYQQSGEYEALRYTDRLISGWSWNRTDYTVVLRNGQVSEYGPGQVRQDGPGVLVLVPVR
ncbi:hypothetical protein OKW30_008391 [Paraburkholderia sp. Clong3]|uniref:hypothetical protein n=1 Tax=Paraburkholderia sp. Clong3 TaxID=2991061 RepID=UPI003D1A70ED